MKRFIKYLILVVCCIVGSSLSVKAADIAATGPVVINRGGVTEAIIVSNYDLGGDASTTKVYSETEGTALSDGIVPIGRNNNSITFHVNLKTLGSTTVTLTFEGKVDSDFKANRGAWALLFTKAFTATNTGYVLPICEGALKYVRVGMQSDDGGTDDLTIKLRAERK